MTKLEKVIGGLKNCASRNFDGCMCEWYDEETGDCFSRLAKDALELLKEQEPRVLTLDEALGGDECWFEFRTVNVGRYADCFVHDDLKKAQIYFTGNAVMNLYELADYGKTWRCWNTRPTDEQRKAVKWE